MAARTADGGADRLGAPTGRSGLTGLLWVLLIVGTACAAVAAYGILSRKVLNPDPFVFGVAAKRLLSGERLYVDFFEAKPPLATLCYAFLGALWPRSYLAVCWGLAALLVVQGLIWLAWFRPRLATAAACLWFVVLYPATFGPFGWLSTEHMSNLCITVVLLVTVTAVQDQCLRGWQYLLAGAATAVAFHCRQNAVLCVLVPLAALALVAQPPRAKLRAVAWLGAGGVLTWLLIFGLACVVSDPASYLDQVFVFPRRFVQVGGRAERFCLVATMGSNSLPALLGLTVGLGLLGPQRRLVLIAIPVALLMCLAPPRSHYNYWALLFPFMTMSLLVGLQRDHPRTPYLELAALAAISFSVFTGLLELIPIARSPSETAPMDEVAAWIDAHAGPQDTLYVFAPGGQEYVLFRSRLLPANKYAISWELDANFGMMADDFDQILSRYLQDPPTVFAIHASKLAEMQEASSQNSPETAPSTRLALELMRAHQYQPVHELNGFHLFLLSDALSDTPGRQTDDAALPRGADAVRRGGLDAPNAANGQ